MLPRWPRIFTILAAGSVILFVGSIGLTIRSYCTNDNFHHCSVCAADFTQDEFSVSISCGLIEFFNVRFTDHTRQRIDPNGSYWLHHNTITPYSHRMGEGAYIHFPRFSSGAVVDDVSSEYWRFRIGIWTITLLSMPLPLLWVYRVWRVRGLTISGRCRTCGYDLRATPARCPECGVSAS